MVNNTSSAPGYTATRLLYIFIYLIINLGIIVVHFILMGASVDNVKTKETTTVQTNTKTKTKKKTDDNDHIISFDPIFELISFCYIESIFGIIIQCNI